MSKHFKGLSFPKTQGIPREVEGICFLQHFWISQKDIRMNGEGSVHILKALVLGDVCLNQWLCLLWVRLWQKHLENQAPPPRPQSCTLCWCSETLHAFGKPESQKKKNSHFGRSQILHCQFWQCLLITPECWSKYLLQADFKVISSRQTPEI